MTNSSSLTSPHGIERWRKRSRELQRSRARRNLFVETLEERRLLAVGPELLEIRVDGRAIENGDVRHDAFRELLFRFDTGDVISPASLAGFQLSRAGANGILGDVDDVIVSPGYTGIGGTPNEVILRFADSLPDDVYGIHVDGSVRGSNNVPFNGGTDLDIQFTLDQGTKIISVVPQPISRDPVTGELSQAKDRIVVYFNSQQLDPVLASNPAFYQLDDELTGALLFPQQVQYTAATNQAVLLFANDLPHGTFHLRIGVSDEPNNSVGSPINVGTVVQRAEYKVYESSIQLDENGDPIPTPIRDNATAISRISVSDTFLVRDVEVEINMDHAWSPDLRVFLVGPTGKRVELIRDVSLGVLGGQIYGQKFNDLDGDGVLDAGEPGLPGWTIFIDDNLNSVLDPGERSTVTDAQGNYSFVGLELGATYRLAQVAQPIWSQSVPVAGGRQELFQADFSAGATQTLRVIPDPTLGNPTTGTFALRFGTRTTPLINYVGQNAATAANIQAALASVVDPGIDVTVTALNGIPIQFGIAFALRGVGTPVDHPLLSVATATLDRGSLAVDTVGASEGFTTSGPANQWHLSLGRGRSPGHSGQQSFYFGVGETEKGDGSYQNNANGTLSTPTIDLRDQRLTGQVFLDLNHYLSTESGFDFARIDVVNSEGVITNLFRSSASTNGFQSLTFDLTPFVGQLIHVDFTFTSDSSVTDEGWYVDDVRVSIERGVHNVTLSSAPLGGIVKHIDFGDTLGDTEGPDAYGYEAFAVPGQFEDITETGQATLQEFGDAGFAIQAGGTGADESNSIARDAAGNLYITGSFTGTAKFGTGSAEVTLSAVGSSDIFLAKYDAAGILLWAIGIGGGGADFGADVEVDAAGNPVVTGRFSSTMDFDPGAGKAELTSRGSTDAFVARFTIDGALDWVRQFGGGSADAGNGLHVDAAGDVVVTGYFSRTVDFDPGPGVSNLVSAGDNDIFVVQLSAAGDLVWAQRYGSTGTDQGQAVVRDLAGRLIVVGSFAGVVDFDPSGAQQNLSSAGLTDAFFMQLTAGGGTNWARRFGGSAADSAMAVAVDSGSNVIAVGTGNGDAFIRKYNAGGSLQWTRSFGNDAADVIEDVAVDSANKIFVTGSFRKTVDFDPGTKVVEHTSVGVADVFVARYTPTGEFDLVRVSGSALDDFATGIVLDADDNALYTGSFRGSTNFSIGPDVEPLTSFGASDAFLVKLALVEGLDDATVHLTPADLDGFQFQFYGIDYDQLYYSTNGLITFGSENADGNNTDLTDPPPQAAIAAFWEDLTTGSGDREAVFWEVRGSGDDQRLIIQWNSVHLAAAYGFAQGPLNFQAVLSERDNSIQFNYQNVTGPLLLEKGTDQRVGSFGWGNQTSPAVAADGDGNYVIVWTASGQDGDGLAIYGRMYDADAEALTGEFRVNTAAVGNQAHAHVAMNANGRFVVVWDTNNADIFGQIFDAAGRRVGGEFRINYDPADTQQRPEVIIDDAGAFVVTWNGRGLDDVDGVFVRRFDPNGVPLGTADEIQHLEILGPPAQSSRFTLQLGSDTTAPIAFAGVGNSMITARNIQNALRNLPTTGNQITVTPITTDEVQTITFTGDPTTGTFTLDFAGSVTADITFAGVGQADTTALNIQNALRALANLGDSLTVIASNDYEYVVTFLGPDGATDQPLLTVANNSLDQGAIAVAETVQGINADQTLRFSILFAGPDGGHDQPLLVHADRLSGVTHLKIEEIVRGDTGELRVNNRIAGAQSLSRATIDSSGNFVVVWQSMGQDSSNLGIFGKRYDAAGVAQPGDLDEVQQISLLGPPAPASTYRLSFDGRVTEIINYTGGNVADAAAIETALRNLANLSDSVTVRPATGTSDEVQRITFLGGTTTGTFVLAHAGLVTAPIAFAGLTAANGVTTAGNIQTALRALANLSDSVTVVPAIVDSATEFLVTFTGPDGGIDQPLLFMVQNNLDAGTTNISEVNTGGRHATDFVVEFLGVDGRQNQPELVLADNSGGVIAMTTTTLVDGSDSEFPVNEITLDNQAVPVIASSAAGQFLVVWEGPDRDGTGLFARLFDANGDGLTSDFQVNTFTEGRQHQPGVIFGGDGNFVITWRSEGQDGDAGGIFARRFDAEGAAVGDELQINALTAGDQLEPDIAARPDGTFVMTWASEAGAGGIHSRRFEADGTPLDVDEIQVSQFGIPSQYTPVVARNSAGDFVVVWVEMLRDPTLDPGVYAQAFFADGSPRSGEIQVPQLTVGNQVNPDVAIDEAGNFIVTWNSAVAVTAGGEITESNIQARRFSATGVAQGDEFTVNTLDGAWEEYAQIGIDASGRFTIVWQTSDADGLPLGISARRFDATGTAIDASEFAVNTTGGEVENSSIDVNASGEFVVVWQRFDDELFAYSVYARQFTADGAPLGDDFLVNEESLFDVFQLNADIALADDGSFVVVWQSDPNYPRMDVMIRRFDATGTPLGGESLVVGDITGVSPRPRISMASDGIHVVTWTDNASGNIRGQRYAADGDLIGGIFVANDPTAGDRQRSSISVGPGGAFLVGWLDYGQGGTRVMVERFTVDNPSVGIKAEGAQVPWSNLVPLWVDGSVNPFVGSGLSTKILVVDQVRQPVFAVDVTSQQIHQLDPDLATIVHSIPLPELIKGDAGLAFAGNTLYLVSGTGSTLYELDPASGAIVDTILLADLGITESISGLAYLNGQVVAQAAASDNLYFLDPIQNLLISSVTAGVSLAGGVAGAGSRGTLFAVTSGDEIVEIDPADGSVINRFAAPFSLGVGLAFVEGYLWVGDASGNVAKLDPDTGIEVGSWGTGISLAGLAGDDGGAVLTAVRGSFRPFVGTILDDEASVLITDGVSPFTGRFVPIEPLSIFDNLSVGGGWTLEIRDTATDHEGELISWKLIINNPDDTPPDYEKTSNIGDDSPNGDNDVDLYRVDVLTAGVITVDVTPTLTLDSVVRVFSANGAELAIADVAGLGAIDTLSVAVPAAGVYLIGISSSANIAYSPLDGSGAAGGTSRGSYTIAISFDHPLDRDDDNSSFVKSTNLGILGQAGQTVFTVISNPPMELNMPGSIAEPGHRHIPPESHFLAGGYTELSYVPNRLLIQFEANTSAQERATILEGRGLRIVKSLSGTLLLEAPNGIDVLQQTLDLASHPAVTFVEPDYLLHTTATMPSDTQFGQLWGLNNTGQLGGTLDADIDAPEAWDVTTGSSNVVIAVIDTGVDYTHPDLAANMWVNPGEISGDGIDNDGNGFIDDIYGIDTANDDSDPMDGNAHGTHVSGTIAAAGDNGFGVVGVNWQARIMGLKFLTDGGFGATSDAIEAIDYMTMMKTTYNVNIVASNNSWGGGGFSQSLEDSIQRSIDAGIVFVAAAGNSGDDTDVFPHYPASYGLDGIISVAATDPSDQLAAVGRFGSTYNSNYGATTVDVAAPGVGILSTTPGNTYDSFGGTSMATPHVSGVIGLLASVAPNASVPELKAAILDGADAISALTGTTLTGARLNAAESLALIGAGGSLVGQSIPTFYFNFQSNYGMLPSGDTPENVITENQKQRTREIFEIYGNLLGAKFVESTNQGLTVVTGDLRAVSPTVPTGPGGVAGISEGSMSARVIMDAAEDWGSSEYGGGWFTVAMHEIGHSLGLGHTYDLPALTIMGSNTIPGAPAAEPVFPGDADVIHGQFLYPTAANDVDLYQFEVPESGRVTAEIVAERMEPNSSLLNATLTLYQEKVTSTGITREVIARNDDYYSSDSWLDLWLEAGIYYIAVTSTGNVGFNPQTDNTGFGGTSEGLYQLSLSFVADSASTLVDTTRRTRLDGDSDGAPGGQFDFWFQSGPTIFVDKMNSSTSGPDGNGSLADPYDTISTAMAAAGRRIVVPATGGQGLNDGDQFLISDGTNTVAVFEFDQDGKTGAGHHPIVFDVADSAADVAAAIAVAINTADNLNTTATADGSVVQLTKVDSLDVRGTQGLLTASNLVRIVGNGGTDGSVDTLADNRPYLLGVDSSKLPLADGAGLIVPQGVTVMIDAGALLKLKAANIDVGTSALGSNRSAGVLQVLGTPEASVHFHSFRNDSVGGDSDGPGEVFRPGDWGGLVFRDDSGLEQDGIFLNWVNFADLNNGGGKVLVNSLEQTFTPIDMTGARPTIANSVIRHSADAAMSANPNSFEDSLGRIGPDIHGNVLVENSINGLFIRIRTQLGEALDRLNVPARWDDTDVIHVVSENLLIGGTPGGPMLNSATGDFEARIDARLRIDPGMIVKLQGSRIEAEMSSQLIAEGTAELPIVLTSLKDDRFGASGNFDTNNDLSATGPEPGQWGGLFFGAISQGSLDHVLITFAGGQTPIEGGFDRFAPLEIHQAEVRVTNSLLTRNEAGQSSTGRAGRGTNEASTIFIRGAQPILVDNSLLNNAGPAISIDANALKSTLINDWGRSTGRVDAFSGYVDNHGPLVRMNLLDDNLIEGMVVRGAVLTAQSVWDDTDIAHVLFDEIILLNHHTLSGLQLQSSDRESLVVKLGDPAAGFTANGQPLDIDDRIGGSLYVLGTSGYPVIFTSLKDDSVGAGVGTDGLPLGDTNNDGPSVGAPGDWRSIRLDRYSNDRNVEVVRESEPVFTDGEDVNAVPSSAQVLGVLAPNLKSGDADRRLGFQIEGFIAQDDPTDLDVYSFNARGGTEVWIDIDRTGPTLDGVVELIMADGTVLASSLDNDTLTGLANPLIKELWRGSDFYTINPRDPGMRVILPGNPASSESYYIRVRSQPLEDREQDLDGGQTSGAYQLHLRLQQVDEVPGSTIRNAEILYATNGIEVLGMPGHSPLVGESAESTASNDVIANAQPLGNLLTSDRNVISTAGSLSSAADVDWYAFTLDYDLIQAIGGVNGGGKTWSTIFDIDYADGLSRPDTTISVFDAAGKLVLVSRDSNIDDDLPGDGQGADTDDLSRGSFGTLDAFIGSVQMPAGVVPAGSTAQYYVAISSNAQLASALNATFAAGSTNSLVRLEPVNSVKRIAEDHIGFSGHVTGTEAGAAVVSPVQSLFDIENAITLGTQVLPFTLADVVLYVSRSSGLSTVNPSTGAVETSVGNLNNVLDLAMRSDGRLHGVEGLPGAANTAGRLVGIDWATSAQTAIGNDAIPDYNPNTNPADPNQLTSDSVDALAYQRTGFDAGAPQYELYYAVRGVPGAGGPASSTLYRANPASGSAAVAQNQPWGVRGNGIYDNAPGDVGYTTGMAIVEGQLFGVSSSGMFYRISTSSGRASNVVNVGPTFAGLTAGPQNLQGGAYANLLFAVDTSGTLYAFDTSGALQGVFANGATSVSTGVGGATGLAFSPADINLWHPTMERRADAGHGISASFDNSRPTVWEQAINGREGSTAEGGASFHFGFEAWQEDPENAYFTYDANAQFGLRTEAAHRDLATNTAIAGSYNVPGGAKGSLASNAFSLAGYEAADKPTLYFNYFLETQGANSVTNEMRDSFRVLASTDGGASWRLLATNNSILSTSARRAELPRFISTSSNASSHPQQRVQELFDNTGGWRQARVDLADFAGASYVQLRFDFSTAGTMNEGTPGDQFGNFNHISRAQQNNFDGAFIDDIMIGFAERGEMVTGPSSANTFFAVPQNPDPAAPTQVLTGPYQLEIRRGTEYGETVSGIGPEIAVLRQFNTNDRMVESLRRLGDQNVERQQGQLRIEANTVQFASGYGILVDAGARDATGSPHPGSVLNVPTLNSARLVPGLIVRNNVIAESGVGGILFSGDANAAGTPLAVVPYGQLVNNTIYGGAQVVGTGITVEQNASPTILNNIVANTANGILVDGTSTSTVIGANLFKSNTNNGVTGSDAIFLATNAPLFVDADRGNFYLAPGSRAIDSSLNRLDDRPEMVAVTSPLGISPTATVAPDRDRFGQLRIDDPLQAPPPGLGSNIFKDRGAVERADFEGPYAVLTIPKNDDLTIDLDPAPTSMLVEDWVISDFEIRIDDDGIGLDDRSVVPRNVTLILNGAVMTQGTDYVFQFDPIGDLIRLSVRADVPPRRNVYEIVLANNPSVGIRDEAANGLRPNQLSGETRFTIMTAGVNDAPVAIDDSYQVNEGAVLTVNDPTGSVAGTDDDGVLVNDTDADFDLLTAQLLTVPSYHTGTFVLNPDGTFVYQHDGSETLSDSFTYQAVDPFGLVSAVGTVFITIAPVNDLPVALDDAYVLDEGSRLEANDPDGLSSPADANDDSVAVNDFDAEGDAISAELVSPPAHALFFVLNPDGTFIYEHDGGETSEDTFQYRQVDDEGGTSGVATVTLTINPVNDLPIANDDTYVIDEGGVLAASDANGSVAGANNDGVLVNDFDAEQETLTAELITPPVHHFGAFVLNANGTFSYQHDGSETLSDSFTYQVRDASGGLSGIATVIITVNPINDPPLVQSDFYSLDEGATLVADDAAGTLTPESADNGVMANDSDAEGDALTIVLVAGPAHAASFTLNDDGTFIYVHDGSETAADSFRYRLFDGTDNSTEAIASFMINPINDPPVAVDDSYVIDEGGLLTADDFAGSTPSVNDDGVMVNDFDAEAEVLTAILVDPPQYHTGTFTLFADGTFEYLHDGSETLSDSFTYEIRDASGALSGRATVDITINPVNDAPVVQGEVYDVDEGGQLVVNDRDGTATENDPSDDGVLVNDSDAEGDSLTAVLVTGPTQDAAFALNADGTFVYQHDGSENTADTFQYVVTDGQGGESSLVTVMILIHPVNDAPLAVDDHYMVLPGTALTQADPDGNLTPDNPNDNGVLVNDSDPEGIQLSAVLVDGPLHAASFQLNPDGTFSYTPQDSLVASDSFTYRANDGELESNVATVTIIFNVPPTAVNDSVLVERNLPKMIDVLANDRDPEGRFDPGSIVIESSPARGVAVVVDGKVEYTPANDYLGADSFTYSVADEHGARTNVATVQIQVMLDPYPWQNSANNLDVNADGSVSAIDVLLIINYLNFDGNGALPIPPTAGFSPPPYFDTSGDNKVTPLDAILVINELNGSSGSGEGEFVSPESDPAVVLDVSTSEDASQPRAWAESVADSSMSSSVPAMDRSTTSTSRLVTSGEVTGRSEIRAEVDYGLYSPFDSQAGRAMADWDDLIEDIAEEIAGAQDDELIADLALNNLLNPKQHSTR
ncbi:MAG: tandem-95 repeat protein [Pirellulaceae bacterium]